MANIGSLIVSMGVDTSKLRPDVEKGKRIIAKGAKKMTASFDKVRRSVFSLKGAFIGLGVGLVAKSFINAASKAENYEIRLNALLGSVEEGNRAFKDMTKFASGVAFEYEEIMGAATQLSGIMRGGVDEINKWMPIIADLAAVSGLGIEKTTEQIVRMYSAGAASADLFRERGITAMLGFEAGVAVSATETRKRLIEAFEDPESKFRGTATKLGDTWTGIMSMMSDAWFQFRTQVMSAGVFDNLKGVLKGVLTLIRDNADAIDVFAERTGVSFINTIKRIALGTAGLIDFISPLLNSIWGNIKMMWGEFKKLPGWAQQIGIIGAFMGGTKGKLALVGILTLLDTARKNVTAFKEFFKGNITFMQLYSKDLDKILKKLKDRQERHRKLMEMSGLLPGGIPKDVLPDLGDLNVTEEGAATKWVLGLIDGLDGIIEKAKETKKAMDAVLPQADISNFIGPIGSQGPMLPGPQVGEGMVQGPIFGPEAMVAAAENLEGVRAIYLEHLGMIASQNEEYGLSLQAQFILWSEDVAGWAETVGGAITGVFDSVSEGIGKAAADAIFFEGTILENLGSLMKRVGASLIQMFIKVGIQRAIQKGLAATGLLALSKVEMATGLKAVYVNTFASAAKNPFTMYAAPEIASIMTGIARVGSEAAGAVGAFETGIDFVPKTGSALVHEGERIFNTSQNEELMEILRGGSESGTTVILEIDGNEFARAIAPAIREQKGDGVKFE